MKLSSSSETLLVEDDELFREGFASEDDARITTLLSLLSFLLRIKEDAEDKKDEEEYDVVGAHVFAFPPSVNAARMIESVLGQVFL